MAVDKITPNDPRIKHGYCDVNGKEWHYLDSAPTIQPRGTIILIHGFPDLSLAWRYQIPFLNSLGFRTLALDCMGYGETGTSTHLHDFSFKTHAEAIAAIAKSIGASRIILGGHDWGGAVVYRAAQWYPELVSHAFSVATPYWGPSTGEFVGLEEVVRGPLPNFGYQVQFGSEERVVEGVVRERRMVRRFLCGLYGGKVGSGRRFMTPERGVDLDVLRGEEVGMTPLMSEEELDFYVDSFTRNGLEGPCNWYRTRRINFEDELRMPVEDRKGIQQPVLFIQALRDAILIPEMSRGMEDRIPRLTRGEVKAGHWALWQTPGEVNELIRAWMEGVVFGRRSKI
ncbi:alpha/beta-hydrolase [Teratosphaeria nubilosa]|uniref:Alpha/beta-hydrolase n=1 Tax=Teratosphaeria nubilosa TaxID=161662 RepID=A0A6G1L7B4_9PEZI|nr:alpha/beta-hydrolase [Teratosphaeria nubilosa]